MYNDILLLKRKSHFCLEELYVTCAQTGSHNDPNRLGTSKKKEPTNTKFNPPVFANSAFDEGCLV